MGCTGSKEAPTRTIHGHSPFLRAQSLPLSFDVATYHSSPLLAPVTLTSSTLGSLDLSPKRPASSASSATLRDMIIRSSDDALLADPAQSWSDMIERHCKWAPLTPTKTPPNEPEVIDVSELMRGLEDDDASPLHDPSSDTDADKAIARSRSALAKLDPDVVYAFLMSRKETETPQFTGLVRERIDAFQKRINARRANKPAPPGGEKRAVLYLTSLRGVRKTFEDCWDTKVILQTYGVVVDERDVAMHGGFKEELKGVLGERFTGKLPQVFADGRHLGGAEEVKRMHEKGELAKALRSCESVPVKKGGSGKDITCSGCGGMRFVPCETCSGSCKVFVSDDGEEESGGFVRCKDCNENGLIRCPLCC